MVTLSVSRRLRLPAAALALTLLTTGVSTGLALGSGSAAGAESAASASAAVGQARLRSGGSAFPVADGGDAACDQVGNTASEIVDVPLSGSAVSSSFSSRPTITGGPGDVSRFDLASAARTSVTAPGGALRAFRFAASSKAVGDYPDDSRCAFFTEAASSATVDVRLPTSGFLTVEVDVKGGGAQGSVTFEQAVLAGFTVFQNTAGSTESTAFLEQGAYTLTMSTRSTLVSTATVATGPAARGRMRATGTFVRAGAATSKNRGAGRRFVTFAGSRDCDAGTLTATVSRKKKRARSIRRVVLEVNGKRAGKATGPSKGRTLTLTKPAATASATVTATVKRTSGSPRTVTRSYAPCSV